MCGRSIKYGLLALLFCWLCLAPGIGQASDYTITATQLQEWKQYNEQQTQIISDLQQRTLNSSASVQSLQKNLHDQAAISKNLKESNEKLIALQNQSTLIIEQQAQTLIEQQKLIDKQESLLAKLKKQQNKHYGIGIYGGTDSAGLMIKKDALVVFGGPRYSGKGYSVNVALLGEF